MKVNSTIMALIAMAATPAFAKTVQMEPQCVSQIQAGVNMLSGGATAFDDNGNPTTVDPKDSASILIGNVKILSSSCLGPDDCDAHHPDAFDYSATISDKDMGIAGKVKVYYHRGNCVVESIQLTQKN